MSRDRRFEPYCLCAARHTPPRFGHLVDWARTQWLRHSGALPCNGFVSHAAYPRADTSADGDARTAVAVPHVDHLLYREAQGPRASSKATRGEGCRHKPYATRL